MTQVIRKVHDMVRYYSQLVNYADRLGKTVILDAEANKQKRSLII